MNKISLVLDNLEYFNQHTPYKNINNLISTRPLEMVVWLHLIFRNQDPPIISKSVSLNLQNVFLTNLHDEKALLAFAVLVNGS